MFQPFKIGGAGFLQPYPRLQAQMLQIEREQVEKEHGNCWKNGRNDQMGRLIFRFEQERLKFFKLWVFVVIVAIFIFILVHVCNCFFGEIGDSLYDKDPQLCFCVGE